MTSPIDENTPLIEERAVLAKYDGDLTEEDIASGEHEPVETITIVDGEIVEHWVKEDN
jgi:hypothetical protein